MGNEKKKPPAPYRDERPILPRYHPKFANCALFTVNGVTRQTLLEVQAAAHKGRPPISGRWFQQPHPLCSRFPIFDSLFIAFSYSAIF